MKFITAILIILGAQYSYPQETDNTENTKESSNFRRIINNFSGIVTQAIVDEVFPECTYGKESVSMTLYTENNNSSKNIGVDEVCDDIDLSKRIVFLVHGFLSFENYINSYKLIPSLLEEKFTVFSLDWANEKCTTGIPSMPLGQNFSVINKTREIGHFMAGYVISVIAKCNVSKENIILIGHSLGAHISGFAAKKVKKSDHGIMPIIIATEPIKAFFIRKQCNNKLCKSDAQNVIVLHTSNLAMMHNVGKTDFYFEGGFSQPQCGNDMECSHNMAVLYLNDIIKYKNCIFYGLPIITFEQILRSSHLPDPEKCVIMNRTIFDNNYDEKGTYFLFTEKKAPNYCFENYKCPEIY